MDLSLFSPRLDIPHGQPLRVDNGRGQRFAVLAGHVWVTQHRDRRDRVLGMGEEFEIDRQGLTILCALGGDAAVARLA